MLTVKLLAIEIGALLIYAGVTGRSVQSLLKGDNGVSQANKSVTDG